MDGRTNGQKKELTNERSYSQSWPPFQGVNWEYVNTLG